jgi:hypothetical protein
LGARRDRLRGWAGRYPVWAVLISGWASLNLVGLGYWLFGVDRIDPRHYGVTLVAVSVGGWVWWWLRANRLLGPQAPKSVQWAGPWSGLTHVASWILTLVPIFMALLFGVLTPYYFGPLVRTLPGWIMICVFVLTTSIAGAAYAWIRRWIRTQPAHRQIYGPPMLLIPMLVLTYPSLWLVLLGPAILGIVSRR